MTQIQFWAAALISQLKTIEGKLMWLTQTNSMPRDKMSECETPLQLDGNKSYIAIRDEKLELFLEIER